MKLLKNKLGFSSVEIILAISVFAIFSVGIFYLSLDTINSDTKITMGNEALYYAQEGLEAVRNIRNKNYLLLTSGDHGLVLSDNNWSFGPAPETIDSFYQRTVTINDVYRNEDGNISEDGTVYDPNTKRIDSEVEWLHNGVLPKSVTLTSYLSNWTGDDWIETTCTEFTAGTFSSTETVPLDSPPADNCGVQLQELEEESEFFTPVNVGKHGEDVDVDGNYAYLATDQTNRGLNIIDISNPSTPTIVGYKDINAKGNYVKKDGSYAYMGIDSSSKGFTIVNVSNPASPVISSQTNAGASGNQPAVFGNYVFMALSTTSNSYKVYDVTSKTSPTLFKTINFGYATYVTTINGNYAYVGVDEDHSSLKVFDISNINNITQVASLDVGEEINAIVISGSTAFIGIESGDSSLKVVNISNPASPNLVTSLNVNGEIQDLTISGDYLYAAIDSVHSGLAAINISNPYSPTLAYNMDVSGKGTGIDSDENYVYISTDTSNKGLVIVGTTVEGTATTGSYISGIYDTGSSDTLYNFIEWTAQNAPVGSLKFQLRTADTSENIASAIWVGPDGTNDTYYENSRAIIELDPDRTGNRYTQVQALFQSDGITTPVLESIRVNYTP